MMLREDGALLRHIVSVEQAIGDAIHNQVNWVGQLSVQINTSQTSPSSDSFAAAFLLNPLK